MSDADTDTEVDSGAEDDAEETSSPPDRKSSFSVYVPKSDAEGDDGHAPNTYMRLGVPSPYLPGGEPTDGDDDPNSFGFYFYTDGNKKEIIKGSKKLELKASGKTLTSASYAFDGADKGTGHTASWSRSGSTSVGLSESRSFSLGYGCSIGVSASQSVSAAASFSASGGISVGSTFDPLSISISKSALTAKTAIPGLGSFDLNDKTDARAALRVSMTAAPHDVAGLAAINACTTAYQIATASIAAATSVMMLTQTAVIAGNADEDGSKDDDIEEQLENLVWIGVSISSVTTLMQALGVALGAVAIANTGSALALDKVGASQVVVTPAACQMRVGPLSYIQVNPQSITINAPIVSINSMSQSNMPALMPPPPI